jgi:tetratricopeptide (TPR) repeat protein
MDSDNADDVLDTYVPRMGHGYVLITSIREITRAHGIKVGNLDPVSAQNLFASILERTPTKEEKVASDQLLQQLDYFPLAINLSATFIHERREAVTTYKTEWNKLLVSLDPTDSNRTLKATIKRSYEHMTYDTQLPHALQLLHFFSCINSQQASEKILERAWQSLYNTANQGTIDRGFSKVILSVFKVSWKDFEEQDVRIQPHWDAVKVEIRTALSLLAKYAFLDFHGDIGRNETGHESWVHIHKIVREFIKYDSDCLKDWLQTTRFTLILALTDTPSIDTGRLIIPHLEHVLEGDKVFETLLPGNNRLFEAAIRVSDAYSLCGHTQETLTLRKKIYHRVKKNDEDRVCDEIPTSALIKATSFLADAYANVSQYEAALKYSHKAYGWEEQRIGKSKGDKFAFLQYGKGLARIYERLGFHEEAYFYRQKALSCSKALDQTGTSPQTLRIEALSADSLNHLGRHKEATEILESTIEQFELQDKLTGIPMHHLLESKYALAKSYDACNRLRDALRERRYILKERRAVDETHQATGIAMLGVANSLYGLGDFAEALELREQSVRLFQKLEDRIPPRDPSILNAKYSLAKSYRKRASQRMSGKYIDLSGATQDISNAVDLNTQIMQAGDLKEPAHHPEVLDCLNEQARCFCYQAKIKMAVAEGSSALKPGARWGESDIMVECFQECLKLQTRILEHWKEVKIRVETKTGVGFEMVVDTNTLDCKILEAENRIAMYHCDFGRLEEAWSMNEAVRKKLEDIKKPKDPLVTAYSDGARILMARRSQHRSSDKGKAKLLHEARKLCLDAYNKSVDNLGNQHKDTIKVLELLAGYTKKPEDYEKLLKVHDEVFGSTHQKSTATLKKLLSSYANLKGSSCYSSRIQFLERRQKEMTQTQQT